jgi:hypothetical protein
MAWQPAASKAVGKLLGAGSPNNNCQATEKENAVSAFLAPISTVGVTSVILLPIDNDPLQILVDTGSSICLIQLKVSSVEIQATAIAPVRITGDRLSLQRKQLIEFRLDRRKFRQTFGVCVLPTSCDGVLGTDF